MLCANTPAVICPRGTLNCPGTITIVGTVKHISSHGTRRVNWFERKKPRFGIQRYEIGMFLDVGIMSIFSRGSKDCHLYLGIKESFARRNRWDVPFRFMGAYLDTGVKVDPNGGGRRFILFQGLGESVEEWRGRSYMECRHTGGGLLSKGLDVIANIYVKIAYIAIGIEVIVVPNAQS
jgi:hypothetical protein